MDIKQNNKKQLLKNRQYQRNKGTKNRWNKQESTRKMVDFNLILS